MRLFRLPCLLLSLAASAVSAQSGYAIGGVALGDTKESAVKALPTGKCYAHVSGGVIDHEICELPVDVKDPIFYAAGAALSFHLVNGRVSAFSMFLPSFMLTEVAKRLDKQYGSFIPVESPTAKQKGKLGVAFLWQTSGANILLEGEAAADGRHGLVISPVGHTKVGR